MPANASPGSDGISASRRRCNHSGCLKVFHKIAGSLHNYLLPGIRRFGAGLPKYHQFPIQPASVADFPQPPPADTSAII